MFSCPLIDHRTVEYHIENIIDKCINHCTKLTKAQLLKIVSGLLRFLHDAS